MAREYFIETLAEQEAIDGRGRREARGAQLPQYAGLLASAFQHQAGRAEERLTQEASAEVAGDMVVPGWRIGLTRRLPEFLAADAVQHGLPVAETRRSRETEKHRALVRMAQLIDLERIGIYYRPRLEIAFEGPERGAVDIAVHTGPVVPVIQIQRHFKRGDFQERDYVTAMIAPRLPQRGFF